MKGKEIFFYAVFVFTQCWNTLLAQCSDAGACSVKLHSVSTGVQLHTAIEYGNGGKTDGLDFLSLKLSGGYELSEKSAISVSVPFSRVSGPLGSTSGIGDAIVLWDQTMTDDAENEIHLQAGAKLATGSSDANGLSQQYQTGLGTNDLILGALYRAQEWRIGIAYQFSQGRSQNTITRLRRGDDIVGQIRYAVESEAITATFSCLAVKRLSLSSVRDTSSIPESFVDIAGSDQFQVNILAEALLPLQQNISLELIAAMPLLKREVNVDGLKRAFTISAGIAIRL